MDLACVADCIVDDDVTHRSIPPTVEPNRAGAVLKEVLEKDPPLGMKVEYNLKKAGTGWCVVPNSQPASPVDGAGPAAYMLACLIWFPLVSA